MVLDVEWGLYLGFYSPFCLSSRLYSCFLPFCPPFYLPSPRRYCCHRCCRRYYGHHRRHRNRYIGETSPVQSAVMALAPSVLAQALVGTWKLLVILMVCLGEWYRLGGYNHHQKCHVEEGWCFWKLLEG